MSQATASKPFVFMMGSHRSGTSALARFMNILGVELGQDLLAPQQGINEAGFWEHRKVVEINESLLARLGSSWYDFRPLPENWWTWESLDDIRAVMRDWLQSEFHASALAGIKDPRLCRLYPLWRDVVQSLGWTPFAVIMYREPGNVSHSLLRRDGFPPGLNKLVWLAYNVEAEFYLRGTKTAFIDYDYLLESPRRMAENLRKYFSELPLRTGVDDALAQALNKNLRHHSGRGEDAELAPDELDMIARQITENFSEPRTPLLRERMDNIRDSLSRYLLRTPELGDQLFVMMTRFVEVNRKLSAMGEMYSHAQEVVRQRDAQVASNRVIADTERKHRVALEGQLREQHAQSLSMCERMNAQALDMARLKAELESRQAPVKGGVPQDATATEKLIGDRSKQLEDVRGTLARRNEELRAMLVKVRDMASHASVLEQSVAEGQQRNEQLAEQVRVYEQGIQALEGRIATQSVQVIQAQDEVASARLDAQSLAARLLESHRRNRKNLDALSALDEKHRHLQAFVASQRQRIDELNKRLDDCAVQEKFFGHQFEQLAGEVADARRIVEEQKAYIATLEANVRSQGEMLAEAQKLVAERDARLRDLGDRYFYLRTRLGNRVLTRMGVYKVPHEQG